MLTVNGTKLLDLIGNMRLLQGVFITAGNETTLSITDAERTEMDEVISLLQEMGLEQSFKLATRVRAAMEGQDNMSSEDVRTNYGVLTTRIHDEIESRCMLLLTSSEAALYGEKQPFGPEVAAKIPGAIDDLDEATKCLALSRGTACVMHLMRAMEVAMRTYAAKLPGVTINTTDEWADILKVINDAIVPMPNKTPAEVASKDIHKDAYACLTSVKGAWRHPSMHARASFTPERAKEIYDACRTFMRQITKVI